MTGIVVWQHPILLPVTVPWLRVYFSRAQLGAGSFVRITSLKDGDQQTLHAEHLEQWGNSTAYFNGNAVLLELVAGPGTSKNCLEVDKVLAGDRSRTVLMPQSICGTTDDRVPSTNAAVGRLVGLSDWCTGWIINEAIGPTERCHLSAGHCFQSAGDVLQFDVPASNANCDLVYPPAIKQFAVNRSTAVWVDGGLGNDYYVFRCFPNPSSSLTTWQQQGSAITLATSMPANNATLRVTGFGLDGSNGNGAGGGDISCDCYPASATGQRNGTQQTATGPLQGINGTDALVAVDLCGGNSGGPVFEEATGRGIAIVSHHGCVGGTNHATLVTHGGVRNAITQLTVVANNDECTGATWIADGVNGPFTNALATPSTTPWPCSTQAGNDVWFSYLAPFSCNVTIDTCATTRTFDTVLQVFFGTCGAMVSVGCNNDTVACGGDNRGSRVTFTAIGNTRYLVRVGGIAGARGNFSLTVTSCNLADECTGAIPLQIGINGPYGNSTATTSSPVWPCGPAVNDIWFRYDAPGPGVVTLSTCLSMTNMDTVLQVFSGATGCAGLTHLACNDNYSLCNFNPFTSNALVTVSGPTTLFARVGSRTMTAGRFGMFVRFVPAGDECANALTVTNGVNGPFATYGASSSAPPWPCGQGGNDIWFRYTAPCTGTLVANTCTTALTFDSTLQVFSGSCSALTSMSCDDDPCGNGASVTVPVVASQTYYLRVGGASGETGSFQLQLNCSVPNDGCSGAIAVGNGTNGPFSNVGATTSAPAWCGRLNAGADVWFRYVASCSAPHTFRTCSRTRTFDTALEVLTGTSCSLGLTSVGCNDDSCATGSSVTAALLQGQTYFVRVGGAVGAQGAFDLEIQPGTGTGSVTRITTGCGATTITASGNPNIGGTVTCRLSGPAGVPLFLMGDSPLSAPLCPPAPCLLGVVPTLSFAGATLPLVLPCQADLIGTTLFVQGAMVFAAAGCPSFAVSDTLAIRIG